jgi:hypothetical protein
MTRAQNQKKGVLTLPTLGHRVGEHGLEVVAARGEHETMREKAPLAGDQHHVAQSAVQAERVHVLQRQSAIRGICKLSF